MHVLVTGAAGFIGSHLVDALLERGDTVVGVDNFDPYYDPAQKRRNIARALLNEKFSLLEGDVRDSEVLAAATSARVPDGIVHLAARAGVRASVEDPHAYLLTNELGGLNVLEACRTNGGIPLVLASTSSVYGNQEAVPFREDAAAAGPLSPYAASKRSNELMAFTYNHLHGQPAAILRFFTVYGPRGRPDMALAKFTGQLLAGETLRIHGEETERDFTFVGDTVAGVCRALDWVCRERGFGTFNLGRGEPIRVRRLIGYLAKALGVDAKIEVIGLQAGESRITFADIEKARVSFGYEPKVRLEEGVQRWADWLSSDEAPSR